MIKRRFRSTASRGTGRKAAKKSSPPDFEKAMKGRGSSIIPWMAVEQIKRSGEEELFARC
ncbi:MAG: hypothetical protein O8C66_15970 [Candidatus Methanoperedens sp.]|nr:hypothetical protein [Candidatus Methanoperedens sp.]MCZ7371992.1 hypothetical protein [Candidatus Methanoperedens sp.]